MRKSADSQLTNKHSLDGIDRSNTRIVGEYTTPNGPYFADRYLVLVDKNCNWAQISFDIPDVDYFIKHLNRRLQTNLIEPTLAHCSDFCSTISYPASLAGKELMLLTPEKGYNPPKNWYQRLLYRFGLGSFSCKISVSLNEDIKSWLNCSSQ